MATIEERRALWILAAMQFANIMDFMIVMPLSPQLMRVFHITQAQFAFMVSAYTFAAAISGLLVARWSDRYPRKQLLLTMFAGFTVATLACALVPNYSLLIVARIFAGLFGGVVGGIVQAYVADLLPPERRGWGMGIVMTAFSFAAVAGVPLGIWLGTTFDWRAPFVFIVVFAIVAGYLACKLLKPLQHNVASGEGVLEILLERKYWYSFGLTVALMMGGFTVIPYISPFLVSNLGFTEGQLAYFYLAGGAATLVSARVIGSFSDRIGKFKAFVWVACLSMIPILLLTHLRPMPMLVIVIILAVFMVFVSGRFIPAMALMSMGVVPHRRGRFMSVNTSVQQFGSGLAALVSGSMLSHDAAGHLLGYNHVGYLAVAATVVAIVLAARVEAIRVQAGVSH